MTPERYFVALRSALATLGIVEDFDVREEFIAKDFGYYRLRLKLVGGDMAEMFEYVVREGGRLRTLNYSFHLQASDGTLIARWDNAPHHPGLDNFPHHCHRGDPERVVSSRAMTGKMFLRELRRW